MAIKSAERASPLGSLLQQYSPLEGVYDEFFACERLSQPQLQKIIAYFDQLPRNRFRDLHRQSVDCFKKRGVAFNHYTDKGGDEKIFPFDLIPRVFDSNEWSSLEVGLKQRTSALNFFLLDVYSEQRIFKENAILRDLVLSSRGYLPKLKGISPPGGVYIHIAGIDIISTRYNRALVLEDNLKIPSGVSYVLENRHMMKCHFPEIFGEVPISNIDDYPLQLSKALYSLARVERGEQPLMVLLTPGPYNSAYFEHLYLAGRMGCPLVRNGDLVVVDGKVFLKCFNELKRVHVIYRRVDDEFLDPTAFNPESLLGVPGLFSAYVAGNVVLANALGNGVADDKAIYPFVPEIIRYYLGEEPILQQVDTFSCLNKGECDYVLDNLPKLVIKVVNQSGGYGMLIGEQATKRQLQKMRKLIAANPRHYIAQPLQQLSSCPTWCGKKMAARRIDFRPFVITGKSSWVIPGGLTRVALLKNSYVVNSSQGGGSKDTWVLGAV